MAASGLVVNSMGWIEDLGYQLLLHSIRALSIDVVLVVGAERLFHTLQQALSCALAGSSALRGWLPPMPGHRSRAAAGAAARACQPRH